MTQTTRLPLPEPSEFGYMTSDGQWMPHPVWSAEQMHAYSDAENAALRERVKVLEDALRKLLMGEEADLTLESYAAAAEHARAVLAARKAAP